MDDKVKKFKEGFAGGSRNYDQARENYDGAESESEKKKRKRILDQMRNDKAPDTGKKLPFFDSLKR